METPATEEHNLVTPAKSQAIQEALVQLYEQQQVYLNPDLTIDDVALAIKTNTKYLSFVLNREMNTSPQTLNRTFARFTGKTPSEWRGK